MEHAIEFLLEHHARVSVEIDQLREAQKEQAANLAKLSETVREGFAETREGFEALAMEMREGFAETREAFSNLILANEVTRDLAQKATRLAIQVSQRVTNLEQKESDSESGL
jgi:hypothetical protein